MTSASAATVAWNILSYLLYAALVVVGGFEVWLSFFFGMATDACHDSACDASFHAWPAMVIMWIGVAAVLLVTLIVMMRKSSKGNVVIGWPFTSSPMRFCIDAQTASSTRQWASAVRPPGGPYE